MKFLTVALAITASLFGVACAQFSVPDGASQEVRYVAALQDYNSVLGLSVAYARQTQTPRNQVDAIIKIVDEVNAEIDAIEADRRLGTASDERLAAVELLLRASIRQLNAYLIREAAGSAAFYPSNCGVGGFAYACEGSPA